MSRDEVASIEAVEESMSGIIGASMVSLILFVGMGGRLLPTWMFLNSLQLIVHVPLLDL
jgi:hypothetical protein